MQYLKQKNMELKELDYATANKERGDRRMWYDEGFILISNYDPSNIHLI